MAALRPRTFDILFVGAGRAGLNAALVFARLRGAALVLDSQDYRNEGIKHIHTVASKITGIHTRSAR